MDETALLTGFIAEFFSDYRHKRYVKPKVADRVIATEEGLFLPGGDLSHLAKQLAKYIWQQSNSLDVTTYGAKTRIKELCAEVSCEQENGAMLPGYLLPWQEAFPKPMTVKDVKVKRKAVPRVNEQCSPIATQDNDNNDFGNLDVTLNPNGQHIALVRLEHGSYLVDPHAPKRFLEKGGFPYTMAADLLKILPTFLNLFRDSALVKRKNSVAQIIKHHFVEAQYRHNNGWIFVIELRDRQKIVKTCYRKDGDLKKAGYRVATSEEMSDWA